MRCALAYSDMFTNLSWPLVLENLHFDPFVLVGHQGATKGAWCSNTKTSLLLWDCPSFGRSMVNADGQILAIIAVQAQQSSEREHVSPIHKHPWTISKITALVTLCWPNVEVFPRPSNWIPCNIRF